MLNDDVVSIGLDAMTARGADRAQAQLVLSEKSELDVEAGEISLLRTTVNARLTLSAIARNRWGSITVNRMEREAVEAASAQAVANAQAAEPDPAHDIASAQPPESFGFGAREPDQGSIYDHLEAFLQRARQRYPKTRLEQCILDFTASRSRFANTNGVRFESDTGIHGFVVLFTTKDGKRTTSFNYSEAVRRGLEEPLERWGSVDELMRQSAEQLDPGTLDGKFSGDLVITPDCLAELLYYVEQVLLGDDSLIRGTSRLKDSLGKQVASPIFTLRSCPVSPAIQAGYFFTPDGFRASDSVLIEQGVLKGFNLSHYGSRKTGKPKAPNAGGCWVVDPGEQPRADMIAPVERGILLCRFSGDWPSSNGDFSGVAKNSYLISGGKIARPIAETMIAGNLADLLLAVSAVSRERVDFGSAVLPWVRAGGVTISGK
jgi:PmbA protein